MTGEQIYLAFLQFKYISDKRSTVYLHIYLYIFAYVIQYTEEKLGQAEKTELDAHLENLIARADCTKNWTEKIFRQTEVLLQPNPSKTRCAFDLDLEVPTLYLRIIQNNLVVLILINVQKCLMLLT